MKYAAALFSVTVALAHSPMAAAEIENPSFEQGWSGWSDTDPSAISDYGHDGVKSAKITGEGGRFEQSVTLYPESDYHLVGYVRGAGTIGVVLGDETLTGSSEGDGEEWIKVSVPFHSGALEEASIYGEFVDGDGRFDAFELIPVNGPAYEASSNAPEAEEIAEEEAVEEEVVAEEAPAEPAEPQVFATLPGACEAISQLQIAEASDDGTSEEIHTPAMTIDSDYDPESRWSSKFPGKMLVLDMERPQTLKEVGVAWYSGNERWTAFEIAASLDNETYTTIVEKRESSGETTAIERYDHDDIEARYIRITGHGNEENEWNSIVEVQAYGCGDAEIASTSDGSEFAKEKGVGLFGLRTDVPPSENFDLTDWKITLPVDRDGDGGADEIEELELAKGWSDPDIFYTDPVTGGMVFRSVHNSDATTQRSSHTRAELREMLRAGDYSINTRTDDNTPNKNNWVFSSAPQSAQELAGGVDGKLTATLAVNRVAKNAPSARVGRVVIGQIHASDDEPIRLYYRKLPTNKFGSIYYAHKGYGDTREDVFVEIIGDRRNNADNPEDGIALDEMFSYEISVHSEEVDGALHPILNVKIIRDDGTVIEAEPFDMVDSGFSIDNDFMFFKAGAYSQSITDDPNPERDYDQVTFFALENTHD